MEADSPISQRWSLMRERLEPLGLEAALQAIENLQGAEDERLVQRRLALQRACYEVSRAQRLSAPA